MCHNAADFLTTVDKAVHYENSKWQDITLFGVDFSMGGGEL